MTTEYVFRHENITLTVVPADMDRYRELKRAFEEKVPAPKPPKIKIQTFEAIMDPDGPGYEEFDDPTDEEYKIKKAVHDIQILDIALLFFQQTCIKIKAQQDTTMISRLVKGDWQTKIAFVNFITSISELTWGAVYAKMEEMEFMWSGIHIKDIETPSSPGRMSVNDAYLQTVSELYGMRPSEAEKVEVPERTEILARYILGRKLQYLQGKKASEDARARANKGGRR